jgi:hypothetical protein
MRQERAWRVVLMVLIAIVGAFAGVLVTGLVIGVETEVGARVTQFGTPLLLMFSIMLVVGSLVFARMRRGSRQS